MKRPDDRSRRFLSLLVVVGSLQLGVACTATQDAKVPRAPSSTAALEVTTPDDKARLEALTKSRLSEGRDFEYRIGPDDLIEVQVPDLMDTASIRGAAPMGQGASIMPVVAQAPTYQQGLRVDADGTSSFRSSAPSMPKAGALLSSNTTSRSGCGRRAFFATHKSACESSSTGAGSPP